jgi:hypothetical protein
MNELEDDSWIHIREPRVVCRRGGTSKISQEIAEKYPMCARYFKIVCDMGWAGFTHDDIWMTCGIVSGWAKQDQLDEVETYLHERLAEQATITAVVASLPQPIAEAIVECLNK